MKVLTSQINFFVSISIRYIKNIEIVERFFRILSTIRPYSRAYFWKIIEVLDEFNLINKIICQIYDGDATMARNINSVKTRINSVMNNPISIHCFAHRINLIIKKILIKDTKILEFYMILRQVSAFFSHSSKKSKFLGKYKLNKIPKFSEVKLNYFFRIVNYMHTNHSSLLKYIDDISKIDNIDKKSKEKIKNFINYIKNPEFK